MTLQTINEQLASEEELLNRHADAIQASSRTALPCEVVSFNPAQMTITARPLLREAIIDRRNGKVSWIDIPLLVDVPVVFPSGGGYTLTFPITPGDECLVVFGDMQIDSWWESGGVQNWSDRRRHDLSDGFAIMGIKSLPNVLADIATDGAALRANDGSASVKVSHGRVDLNGTLYINNHKYLDHTHGGVQTGGSSTTGVSNA